MEVFIKSVDTPDEAVNFFKQLQPILSKYGLELKKLINAVDNCNRVTKKVPEDLNSIINTKQVALEHN